jgi:hypothetical protein
MMFRSQYPASFQVVGGDHIFFSIGSPPTAAGVSPWHYCQLRGRLGLEVGFEVRLKMMTRRTLGAQSAKAVIIIIA